VKAAIEDLISANRTLRSKLLGTEEVLTQTIQLLDEGASVGEVLATVPSVMERRAAEDAVKSLYEARHRVREAVIPAAIADGMSVGEIAAAFGVPLESIISYADRVVTERRNSAGA
jgi:DNA-directed RNA polymerase specialized sigma24 family protein